MQNLGVLGLAAAALVALLCGTARADPPATLADLRHLLGRTGFGAPAPDELSDFQGLSYVAAVDRILDGARTEPVTAMPAWVGQAPPDPREVRALPEDEQRAFRRRLRELGQEAKSWWYAEMLATESPFTERMVLFWHNHFTSDLRKVRWPAFLLRQNSLFRRHALGSFATLLSDVATRDAAMLLYLDGHANTAGSPNENFARELLELFTLGEGHYTEADIRDAARAFTGLIPDLRNSGVRFVAWRHDGGTKTVLGHTGPLNGQDVLHILLHHPRTAEHIVEKLWRAFVSPEPDPATVDRLAGEFRDSGYSIRAVMRALLLSDAFRDPANRGVLIKDPVDITIGSLRLIGLRDLPQPGILVRAGMGLGQDVFQPPNVKGWPGGTDWITTQTLLRREQILTRLVSAVADGAAGTRMGRVVRQGAAGMIGGVSSAGADLAEVVLAVQPVEPLPEGARADPFAALRHLILDPAYQVK